MAQKWRARINNGDIVFNIETVYDVEINISGTTSLTSVIKSFMVMTKHFESMATTTRRSNQESSRNLITKPNILVAAEAH